METTYNVRIWDLQARKNSTGAVTSYRVRWRVDRQEFRESFKVKAQADSFRAELVAAQRQGIAFETSAGLPVTMTRQTTDMPWFEFACEYLDARWPEWSPMHRKNTARELMKATLTMLPERADRPDESTLRAALMHVFNKTTRQSEPDLKVARAAAWASRHSSRLSDLIKPDFLRMILHSLELNRNGQRASVNTARLRRIALSGAIDHAVERDLLDSNPLAELKHRRRKQTMQQVDPRSVVNTMQARMLLDAVPTVGKPGPPLAAFFGALYYAALRPEEAANLKKANLSLPAEGWGTIHLEKARPEVGELWTDTRKPSEERSLKHRDDDTGRTVPCPPQLTEMLHQHLNTFGTATDGRLFRGARDGGRIPASTYGRVWAKARRAVFTAEVADGPLAKRPYDLRHAAVSTWLNGGVEPTRVAKWAGHSVRVLLEVYAKCLDGGEQAARARVENALREW